MNVEEWKIDQLRERLKSFVETSDRDERDRMVKDEGYPYAMGFLGSALRTLVRDVQRFLDKIEDDA